VNETGDRELTVTEALDALVREIAAAGQLARSALASCRLCRNHLLYLLDRPGPEGSFSRMVQARLRAMTEAHRAHGRPGHPDASPPQIRGIGETAGNSGRSEPEGKDGVLWA